MSGTKWDDGQLATSLPVTPPSWHQITSVPASECSLKKLQRPLTAFKGQSARFSRPSSGRGFPPPSWPDLRTKWGRNSTGLLPSLWYSKDAVDRCGFYGE